MNPITRREFGKAAAGAAAATALGGGFSGAQTASQNLKAMVGLQVGAVSFLDEGVEPVLDNLQTMGAVNTLFIATFTYGTGIAGRQVKGMPFPDHGKQEYDTNFRGGFYTTPHPQFFKNTAFKPEHASEIPDNFDVLEKVLGPAHKRGMKVICWYEDVFRADRPGFPELTEVDAHGQRKPSSACLRNPNTIAFWLGQVEDYLKSYEVDGLMFGSERMGPLGNTISASHGGIGAAACFCPHCVKAAQAQGLNAERARTGYLELEKLVAGLRKGLKPSDGAFVSFWRLLVDYPEILGWERLWNEGLRDVYRAQFRKAHEIRPGIKIGWHIWHNNSFSPFYRAEQDYAELGKTADFFKVVMYNNCAGPRMVTYVRNVSRTIFSDFTPEQVLQMTYGIQQFNEKPLAELTMGGLSADYVTRETKRALATSPKQTLVWPGIDIDVPTGANQKQTTPEDAYQSVKAAFQAGAPGVILSRKYSEMRLANLKAAGRAAREFAP